MCDGGLQRYRHAKPAKDEGVEASQASSFDEEAEQGSEDNAHENDAVSDVLENRASGQVLLQRERGEDHSRQTFGTHDGHEGDVVDWGSAIKTDVSGRNSDQEHKSGEDEADVNQTEIGELDGYPDVHKEKRLKEEDGLAKEDSLCFVESDGLIGKIAAHPGHAVEDLNVAENSAKDGGGNVTAKADEFNESEKNEYEGRRGEDGIFEAAYTAEQGRPKHRPGSTGESSENECGDDLTDHGTELQFSKSKADH